MGSRPRAASPLPSWLTQGRSGDRGPRAPAPSGLTSAAERVLAERARGRPQQGQRGPGERTGHRASASHLGRPRPRPGLRPCHPPPHLWGQRCGRGLRLGGRSRGPARAGRRRAGLPGSSGLAGLGLPGRRPARGRAQVAPGRALFLARAALPVRPTEPVDSAARARPAPPPELPGKARAALLKTDPSHSCLRFAGKPAASSLNAAPGPRAQGPGPG